MEILYVTSFIILCCTSFVAAYCPAQESLLPCRCSDIKDGISVQCQGPEPAGRIASVIESLDGTQNLELVLDSLTLPSLPTSLKDVSSLHLYNVRIQKMPVNSSQHMWAKLSEVIVSTNLSEAKLPDFRGAHLLNHLEISGIEMSVIGSEFKATIPEGLTYLDVRKTKTTTLNPGTLSHLRKLQYFIMVDVPLRELSRDVLPLEMPDLYTFILGNTRIEKLDENFFQGMPKLEIIMLNGNQLKSLDYAVFSPVENQLSHFLAERNPLTCDCSLLWLTKNVQNKGSMKVLATCTDERINERRKVTGLDESEYCA